MFRGLALFVLIFIIGIACSSSFRGFMMEIVR